jgi:exopolysaccharide production protein ExoY
MADAWGPVYFVRMKRNECCQDRTSFRFFAAANQRSGNGPSHASFESTSKIAAERTRVPSWKRVLDIVFILAGAILWAPVCLIIGILIKIVSPGPILFQQERVGHTGKMLRCLKFRTMSVNADTGVHQKHLTQLMTSNQPMKKLDGAGDTRLIPGGLWLRSLGLDELPQLMNVLRGEMSMVGPRPCVPYEYAMFQPRHRQRCDTLPGLTGLWQVNGKNRTTFEKMMELDLAYVERKSLLLDLKIMAFTVPAIFLQVWDIKTGRKAAPALLNRQLATAVIS